LKPLGLFLEPPWCLLTHLHTVYMAYSECPPTRLNPPWLRGPVSPRLRGALPLRRRHVVPGAPRCVWGFRHHLSGKYRRFPFKLSLKLLPISPKVSWVNPLVAHRSNFVCASLLAQKLTYLPFKLSLKLLPISPNASYSEPELSAVLLPLHACARSAEVRWTAASSPRSRQRERHAVSRIDPYVPPKT
jgi:hypothetical protein